MRILIKILICLLLSSTVYAQGLPPVGVQDEGGAISRPVTNINCVGGGIDCSFSVNKATLTVAGTATVRYDQIVDPGTNSGDNFGAFTNAWTSTLTTSDFFTLNGSGQDWTVLGNGNLGIGDATPTASLVVGAADAFQVNSSGAIAAATGVTSSGTITLSGLVSCDTIDTNGSGILVCGSDATGSSVSSGKWNNLTDPDNNFGLSTGAFTSSWTSALTTTDFFSLTANSLTTADVLNLNVAATTTTGDALEINRGGTKVFGIDGFGVVSKGGENSVNTNNSAINYGAFTNSWTFTTGVNTWTSTSSSTNFFDIEARTQATGNVFDIKVDDGMTTGHAFQVLGGATSTFPVISVDDANVGIGNSAPSTTLHVTGGTRITGLVSCDTIDTDTNGVLACGTDATGGGSSIATRYDEILDPTNAGGITFGTFANSWTSAATTTDYFTIDATAITTGDLVNLNMPTTSNTGDALEINRGGTKVAGIDGYGTLSANSENSVRTNRSAINSSTFANSWTSAITTTNFFDITANTASTGDVMRILADDSLTTGHALRVLGGVSNTAEILSTAATNVGIGTSNPTGKFQVVGVGNVGIGNTNPAQKLDVTGVVQAQGWQGTATFNSGYDFSTFSNSWTFASGATNTWTSTAGDAAFFRVNNSSNAPLVIRGDGNMGIGDTDPANKLSVSGNITSTADITSSDPGDIGWSVVDQTDNQACTTGCTSACVFGIDNATGAAVTTLVSCAATTADLCVCAGAS